jgi:Nucleotidyl transferase AbiEii toxin, Type IV TA system
VKAVLIEVGQILGAFKGKFAVIGGAELALRFYQMVAIEGSMPSGGVNRVEIAVCSIPALLAMKGHAINGRYKQKDSYDIYYCIRNYPDGIERLAEACRPLLQRASGARGFGFVAAKFDRPDAYGPTCVRRFVEDTSILEGRTPDQWQQDAFGQVDAWLRALGLRG